MKYFISILTVIALLSSCVLHSSWDEADFDDILENERYISFSVRVPGMSTPTTRMMTTYSERHVQTIDILLFDQAGNFKYQPLRPDDSPTLAGDLITFTVRLPEGIYDVAVFANARQSIQSQTFAVGTPKAAVMQQIVLNNGGQTWNVTNSFTPIPMWGEIIAFNINTNTAHPATHAVNLTRMVAKIDVQIADNVDNFVLESVRFYNANDRGQVAPTNPSAWQTTPSVPASATKNPNSPWLFQIVPGDQRLLNTIYTFESAAGTLATRGSNTSMVIGGTFGNDAAITYYRIEMSHGDTHLPLLRNHRYLVNISEVGSRGYPTPEIAFASHAENLAAQVAVFDIDSDILSIVFLGRYLLGASSNNIEFPTGASTYRVDVHTNFEQGWTITGIVNEDGSPATWLTSSHTTGSGSAAGTTTRITLSAAGNGTDWRTAYIHIRAGRMELVIRVNQVGRRIITEGHGGWAGSNIYWVSSGSSVNSPGRFTFDDIGSNTQARQGVFFRWGSLIARGAAAGNWSNDSRLYLPNGQTGPVGGTSTASLSMPTWGYWSSVLNDFTVDEPDRAFLYEITDGNVGIGDICRYMTKRGWTPPGRWRMPTAAEFGAVADYTVNTTSGWSVLTGNEERGTTLIGTNATPIGWRKNETSPMVSPIFPASGFALGTTGSTRFATGTAGTNTIRTAGRYWSSSPTASGGSTGTAFGLRIGNETANTAGTTVIAPQARIDRRIAAPVRCVLEKGSR